MCPQHSTLPKNTWLLRRQVSFIRNRSMGNNIFHVQMCGNFWMARRANAVLFIQMGKQVEVLNTKKKTQNGISLLYNAKRQI